MRKMRTLVVLAAVTVAFVLAAVLMRREPSGIPESGKLLFPQLLAKVNEVTRVEGHDPAGSFTIVRKNGNWVVAEKSDYPAAEGKVRNLLVGVGRLRRIEPKTKNPALYADLGLAEAAKNKGESEGKGTKETPEAQGPERVTLKDAQGSTLASLIVGKRHTSAGDPMENEYYVRVPDSSQTWLVEGQLPYARSAAEWVRQEILKLDDDRVREVRVTPAKGEPVTVERDNPGQSDYRLADMPPGAKVSSSYDVNSIARTMADLTLDDVRPASALGSGATPAFRAELDTFDGLRVQLSAVSADGGTWATLTAAFDPALVGKQAEPAGAPDKKEGKTKEQGGAPAPPSAAGPKKHSPAEVRKEAAALTRRWQGWAYALNKYRVQTITRKKSELFATKAGAGKGGAANKPAAGGTSGSGATGGGASGGD